MKKEARTKPSQLKTQQPFTWRKWLLGLFYDLSAESQVFTN